MKKKKKLTVLYWLIFIKLFSILDENTKTEVPDDIEAELQSEILVKGGVVRAIQREQNSEIRPEPGLTHNFLPNNDFACFDGNEPTSSSDIHVQLPGK